jgi:hypothetical protein
LTLYWQALSRMAETYVVFDHLLDERQRNWGGYDRWPQETARTTLWRPGEVVVDAFNVPIAAAAPDGIYTLDIGLYDQADPAATPLPLWRAGRPLDQNSVRIGPLKVGGPPPEAVLAPGQATPQARWSIQIQFGQPPVISGYGYDLTRQEDSLRLRLYWQSLAPTGVDWSVFAHVRNTAGQTIAQKDGPAGGGRYPTSLWDAGEIIADDLLIPLPAEAAAGEYQLVIGLYDLQTGQRLAVPGSAAGETVLDSRDE